MNKHKILFVDDEENILRSLKRLFSDENYEVYIAGNGNEGLKLLDDHKFALILSDYRMPELNGVDFLKLAKEKSPDTIRMILTGFADVSVAISAINEGEVYKFIEKPWEGENLKVQIKRAVEHYSLIAERKGLLDKIQEQNEELKRWNETLENRVEEKTLEVKSAYEKLQLKVRELEGRDKILRFLLTIHSFEETLDQILDVIIGITSFEKIVIYISDPKTNNMYAKAGITYDDSKKQKLTYELNEMPQLPIPEFSMEDKSVLQGTSSINKINEFSSFIPVEKGGRCLGVILVDNSKSKKVVEKEKLKILSGFSSLAALAINEHLVTEELPDLQDKIDEFLGDLK